MVQVVLFRVVALGLAPISHVDVAVALKVPGLSKFCCRRRQGSALKNAQPQDSSLT